MAQNYRDKDLQGHNFAGQDLTNADFRGADVSNADFSGANLTGARFTPSKRGKTQAVGANFHQAKLYSTRFAGCDLQQARLTEAKTGPRGWVAALKGLLGFALSFVFTYIASLFNAALVQLATDPKDFNQIAGMIGVGIVALSFVYILSKGINNQILTTVVVAVAVAVAVAFAVAFAFAFAVAGAFAFAVAVAVAVAVAFAVAGAGAGAVAGAGATALFVLYIAWRTHKGDAKFALLHDVGVRIGIIGSTSFVGADLSHADFAAANLRFADFRRATFIGTSWAKVQRLQLAQFDRDYLHPPALRTLAIARDGRGQVYNGLNLSGLNLAGAQLQGASFVGATLNFVNLRNADLSAAVLKQTQLDGADLSNTILHGATIEDWGITVNTKLDDIQCSHVYMRAAGAGVNNRLRKPDNEAEVFGAGDFAEFIRPLTDTLDLYHSQGVDPRAMSAAIKHMSELHPDAEPQIVAMERRGPSGFNTRLKVAPDADKSAMSADYFAEYQRVKVLAEAEKQTLMARLEEKDSRIVSLENMISLALQPQRYYDDPDANLPSTVRALVPLINTHFSFEEVEGLCFEMGIDDENLRGQTKIAKIRALVKHCHRTATIEALKQHLLAQRPNLRDQLG